MPLFVRDEKVDALVTSLEKRLQVSKTEVIRRALKLLDELSLETETLVEIVARIQNRARAKGLSGRPFDDKALMDDLSGGI